MSSVTIINILPLFYAILFCCCWGFLFICCLGNDKHHPKTICISVFHLTTLPWIFRTPTVKNVSTHFCLYSNIRAAKSPMLHFCFKVLTEAACSCCALCWSPSCSSLHTHRIETNRAAVWSKLADVRTYCLIPGRAVCSRVPSLNQTAALSQSSVLHFVVALTKFSINCCAAHSIFYLSPKELGLTSCLLCCSFLDGDQ